MSPDGVSIQRALSFFGANDICVIPSVHERHNVRHHPRPDSTCMRGFVKGVGCMPLLDAPLRRTRAYGWTSNSIGLFPCTTAAIVTVSPSTL